MWNYVWPVTKKEAYNRKKFAVRYRAQQQQHTAHHHQHHHHPHPRQHKRWLAKCKRQNETWFYNNIKPVPFFVFLCCFKRVCAVCTVMFCGNVCCQFFGVPKRISCILLLCVCHCCCWCGCLNVTFNHCVASILINYMQWKIHYETRNRCL